MISVIKKYYNNIIMQLTGSIIKSRRTSNRRTSNRRTTNKINKRTTNKINRRTSNKKLKNIIPRDINGIEIRFEQLENGYRTIMIDEENDEVGEFKVNKLKDIDNHIGHDLGIHINDKYLKKGYSKKLIKLMTNNLISKLFKKSKHYIDDDASWEPNERGILTSFWDKIGMEETPEDDPYYGYEKRITLDDLYKFSHKKNKI